MGSPPSLPGPPRQEPDFALDGPFLSGRLSPHIFIWFISAFSPSPCSNIPFSKRPPCLKMQCLPHISQALLTCFLSPPLLLSNILYNLLICYVYFFPVFLLCPGQRPKSRVFILGSDVAPGLGHRRWSVNKYLLTIHLTSIDPLHKKLSNTGRAGTTCRENLFHLGLQPSSPRFPNPGARFHV